YDVHLLVGIYSDEYVFSSRRRHTRLQGDWSSDVCSSDLEETQLAARRTAMMQGEKIAGDLRDAQDAVSGNQSPIAALAAAVRRRSEERRVGKGCGPRGSPCAYKKNNSNQHESCRTIPVMA